MRTLVAVTSLLALGLFTSCVNVDKPALIAECEQPGGCPTEDDGGLDAPLGDLAIGQDESLDQSAEETSTDVRLDSARDRVETGAPDGPQIGPDGTSAGPDTVPNADTFIVVPDTAPPVLDAPAEAPVDVPPDADEGDVPSVLNGTCSYNGKAALAGTICRLATEVCDVSETCDGISTACPLDKFLAATEVCRPKAGDCDVAELCTGFLAACPADKLLAKSASCRPAALGGCDVAEYCDGSHAVCPVDAFNPTTTQCRASADGSVCDPAEFCTGTSNACPTDAKFTRPTAAPTGVAVAAGTLQADVSWTAISGDAGTAVTGYNVKSSSISTGGFTVRGSPTTSPFTVTPITAGQPFFFVVSSYAGLPSCESANSAAVSAQSCVAIAPATPTATPDNTGSVTLTWSLVSSAPSYNVSRSTTKGGPYTVVVNGLSATSYKDNPFVPANGSATYYYVVRANTGSCNSPYSPEATATITSPRADAAADTAKD